MLIILYQPISMEVTVSICHYELSCANSLVSANKYGGNCLYIVLRVELVLILLYRPRIMELSVSILHRYVELVLI